MNGIKPLSDGNSPKKRFKYMGHRLYKEVNINIPYTGNILIGKDFIREYYIHMGYQRSWAYKILTEFVFEEGMLINTIDHSAMAEELRRQIKENPDFMKKLKEDIPLFVESCFALDMATKAWWIK